ncbi:MAG: sulfurtransferase-like selenium metabolism protein YedF [Deltaproteobacteria bacterium]|nr:sulfurtransferase-like selenium metabolism protein YedF [Deltaproteobacteria bacterium]MBW2116566.1 sulfurtransferase-like selenium metabolism protein YedF [Deltaproteobacteria bacterium]MBW2344125.1 sulfurtransferase-like selenium metabolism protein YedF [Deltaproteobacteria bacterium]
MTKEIDCRGLACPAPVLQTKQALEKEQPNAIKVVVDNEASKQNVSRFMESQNLEVTVLQEGADFHVIGKIDEGTVPETPVAEKPEAGHKKIMVMVANDRMGHGDDELGEKLMVSFLKTLKEMGEELWRLVFVNNGVKLTIKDSDVLPVIQELENDGIHILVCGTCLTHFDLLDQKQAGETTNMLDIVTAMQLADKVINI